MAATETGAGLAAAAFLYVVKILNGRATYGEFAYICARMCEADFMIFFGYTLHPPTHPQTHMEVVKNNPASEF